MAIPLQRQLIHFAALRKQQRTLSGQDIAAALREDNITTLFDALPNTNCIAVSGDPDDVRKPLTHSGLRSLIEGLNLASYGIQPGVRVGVIVSNGPELGVLLVALLATAAVVPINSAGSLEEFTSELVSTGAQILITDDGDSQRLAALTMLASQLALPLLVLTKDSQQAGAFKLAQAFHISTVYSGITQQPSSRNGKGSLEMITIDTLLSSENGDIKAKETEKDQSFLAPLPTQQSLNPGPDNTRQPMQKLVSFRMSQPMNSIIPADGSSDVLAPTAGSKQIKAHDSDTLSSKDFGAHGNLYVTEQNSFKDTSNNNSKQSSPQGSLQLQNLRSLRCLRSLRRQQSSVRSRNNNSVPGHAVGPLGGQQVGLRSVGSTGVGVFQPYASAGGDGESRKWNSLDDDVLILQTSGSTGSKKVVPYTLEAVLVGCCAIAASMELTPSDMAINMMPLFHAGGIFRNVLAPILAGGSTCCMAIFDACQFWQVAEKMGATWYYASPTMHMGILDILSTMDQLPSHNIRLIANAAGPLLPATAESLKVTFRGAAILPGYGMTECMPISAPPSTYQLDRPGSSGLPLGPDLLIGSDQGDQLPRGTIGEILIKGLPLFKGYDGNEQATADSFVQGHFKTGDLGYQDEDGYLFITGRSKDVINRGGEIISPAEVESAAMQVPGIRAAAAFPAGHDKLQECVGLVVVPTADAADPSLRPLLPEIIECLSGLLHPSKWPFMLVYMDELPKGPTGKVVRTGLAKRLGLPEFSDKTPMAERHYQATAPPTSAPVTSKIPAQLASGIDELMQQKELAGAAGGGEYVAPSNRLEKACVDLVAQVVGMEPSGVSVDADFFVIGGSSMNASQLAALLRKTFQVSCTGLTVFNYRTPAEISSYLLEQKPELQEQGWLASPDSNLPPPDTARLAKAPSRKGGEGGVEEKVPDPSLNPLVLLVQAIPLFILTPLRRVCTWILFIYLWFIIANDMLDKYGVLKGIGSQIWALIIAIWCTRIIRNLVLPFVGIAAKWMIVGRYKEGRYKLWGAMYLRWWMADKIILLTGPGFFAQTPGLSRTYLRLMGAKVGSNVSVNIEKTRLREFDLLTIEDGVVIDSGAYLRCFAADNGQMILGPITLGRDSCVCTNGIVPIGTSVPPNAGVSHNSCALEGCSNAADLKRLCRNTFPGPPMWMQLLIGYPLEAVAKLVALAPIIVLLLVALPRLGSASHQFVNWQAVLGWLVDPYKILVYLIGAICYSGVCPFLYLATVILMKRVIIGKFTPGPRGGSNWQLFRHWFMALLLPDAQLGGVLPVIGTHWALVSHIYRALGAKIGKRVFWPGSGLLGVVEYDLLTIGDDAVFGSRSTFLLSDAEKCSEIKIHAGGNVTDRCILLPGSTIGKNACLGTGGVLGEGQYLEPGAVAVGCQNGSAVVITPGSEEAVAAPTIKPFGKAQYLRESSYWLPPVWIWVLYNWFAVVSEAVLTRSRMVIAWLLVYSALDFANNADSLTFAQFFGTMLGIYSALHVAYTALTLAIVIGSKWLVIGRRQPGDKYSWDESSYCARWNVCLALQPFKGKILDSVEGSAYMVWYFRSLGCKIGRAVCLYPTGSDPVMTEPELVTIGNNACINYAFIVNHINTKGQFSLQRTFIGNNTTLRAWSRLMAGGTMEDNSVMLEHTLALPGETVDTGMAWQGWPVSSVAPAKILRLQSTRIASPRAGRSLDRRVTFASTGLSPKPSVLSAALTVTSNNISPVPSTAFTQQVQDVPEATSTSQQGPTSLSNLTLRKSLRLSNSLQVYNTSGLLDHLEQMEQNVVESADTALVNLRKLVQGGATTEETAATNAANGE